MYDDDDDDVLSTPAVADELGVDERDLRDWAADHGVSRVGNSYAWLPGDVDALIDDLEDEDEDDDEDDDY